MVKISGIYKIYFNQTPDVFYIGSAVNITERMIRHRHLLKKQIHKNTYLQRSYNKYGTASMSFEIIEIVNDASSILDREQYYINELAPKLNVLRIAGNCLGYKHTEETKTFLSKINIGRKMSDEQNIKNSIAQKGNKNAVGAKRTDEYKERLRLIKQKKVINTETNEIYASIGIAACSLKLKYQTLYAKLSGRNFNDTKLIFL